MSGLSPSALKSSTISRPAVPWPAMIKASSSGGTSVALRLVRKRGRDGLATVLRAIVKHDLSAERCGALALGPRRVVRHDDDARHAQKPCRRSHALRMVAGGECHDAAAVAGGMVASLL